MWLGTPVDVAALADVAAGAAVVAEALEAPLSTDAGFC